MSEQLPKIVEAEYIESGAFQGGEEDAFRADIKPGDECVALKAQDFASLLAQLAAVTRERDEARAKVALCEKEINGVLEYTDKEFVVLHHDHPFASLALTVAKLNHFAVVARQQLAAQEADSAMLDWLEKALSNMPDLEIRQCFDEGEEDSIGLIPKGWNIRCDSICTEPLTINAPTLRAAIAAAMKGE